MYRKLDEDNIDFDMLIKKYRDKFDDINSVSSEDFKQIMHTMYDNELDRFRYLITSYVNSVMFLEDHKDIISYDEYKRRASQIYEMRSIHKTMCNRVLRLTKYSEDAYNDVYEILDFVIWQLRSVDIYIKSKKIESMMKSLFSIKLKKEIL